MTVTTAGIERMSEDLKPRQALRKWFTLPLGQTLLEMEKNQINQILSNLFGYHIVQLGCLNEEGFLGDSRISHKVMAQLDEDGKTPFDVSCINSADGLPLASDSIDVLVLPHVLEFTEHPHKLLREIERVLIGEGHLVVTGFNPFSLWGVWRLFLAWRDQPPWHGYFYRLFRIKDWLTLLDFEIVRCVHFFYRPPIQKVSVMQKLMFLEKLGKYCWPIFSGTYIIVAKKRVIPLTPVRSLWHDRRKTIASGIAEPTARS